MSNKRAWIISNQHLTDDELEQLQENVSQSNQYSPDGTGLYATRQDNRLIVEEVTAQDIEAGRKWMRHMWNHDDTGPVPGH